MQSPESLPSEGIAAANGTDGGYVPPPISGEPSQPPRKASKRAPGASMLGLIAPLVIGAGYSACKFVRARSALR